MELYLGGSKYWGVLGAKEVLRVILKILGLVFVYNIPWVVGP
jgi:hypothetical protein